MGFNSGFKGLTILPKAPPTPNRRSSILTRNHNSVTRVQTYYSN